MIVCMIDQWENIPHVEVWKFGKDSEITFEKYIFPY